MRFLKMGLFAGAAVIAIGTGVAQAASYSVDVITGLSGGNGFTTTNTPPFSGATANFTYTGDLNFNNTAPQNQPSSTPGDLNSSFGFSAANVSGYAGSGTVTFNGTQVANFANLGSPPASRCSAPVSRRSASFVVVGLLLRPDQPVKGRVPGSPLSLAAAVAGA